MKKILITSLLVLGASLAYAGSGCGGACTGDKKDKKDTKTGLSETSVIVAGAGCGAGCGDKKDKDKKEGFSESSLILADGCGAGCGDKKDKKDKKADGLFEIRELLA